MMEVERKGEDTATSSESEGYIADDETRPGPTQIDNHIRGGTSHLNLQEKPGLFSRMGHKLCGQQHETEESKNATAAPYMEYDEGVKPPFNNAMIDFGMQQVEKGFGSSEVGTGYEEGSEGSFSHTRGLSDFSFLEA